MKDSFANNVLKQNVNAMNSLQRWHVNSTQIQLVEQVFLPFILLSLGM